MCVLCVCNWKRRCGSQGKCYVNEYVGVFQGLTTVNNTVMRTKYGYQIRGINIKVDKALKWFVITRKNNFTPDIYNTYKGLIPTLDINPIISRVERSTRFYISFNRGLLPS